MRICTLYTKETSWLHGINLNTFLVKAFNSSLQQPTIIKNYWIFFRHAQRMHFFPFLFHPLHFLHTLYAYFLCTACAWFQMYPLCLVVHTLSLVTFDPFISLWCHYRGVNHTFLWSISRERKMLNQTIFVFLPLKLWNRHFFPLMHQFQSYKSHFCFCECLWDEIFAWWKWFAVTPCEL